MDLPRMRTAPEAIKEIKEKDPNSCLTLRALRRMMNTGEIPVISVNTKKLVNMDTLFDYLSAGDNTAPSAVSGDIRRIY